MVATGDVIAGRYEIKSTIKTTAQVGVFKVADRETGQTLLLKIASDPKDAEIHLRLKREFYFLGRLSHPSVVKALDFGRHQDRAFIVEEFVPGEPATAILHGHSTDVFSALVQLLDGLQYIHEQQFVHHDLKPENILYDPAAKRVKLVDFGFAESTYSPENVPRGSIGYIAPEIIKGMPASPQTDLFSFGVVLYEILTGQNPYFGKKPPDSPMGALRLQFAARPPAPSLICAGLPQKMDELVLSLLAIDPYFRPRTARAVTERLSQVDGFPDGLQTVSRKGPGAVSQFNPQSLPFVGRVEIIEALKRMLDISLRHPGVPGGDTDVKPAEPGSTDAAMHAAVIKGDIGIGKSRLIQELKFAAQLEGWSVTFCSPGSGSLFRTLRRRIGLVTDTESVNNFAAYEDLTRHLAAVIAKSGQRHILLVDDLDHYDEFDIGLFRYLAYCGRRLKMSVAGTLGDCPAQLEGLAVIEVPALNRAEAGKLVDFVRPDMPGPVIENIFTKSGGNPLVLIAILQDIVKKPAFGPGEELAIPEGVRAAFEPLLDRLSKEELALLRIAGLFRTAPSSHLLQTVFSVLAPDCGDEHFFSAVQGLMSRGLLRSGLGGTYSVANQIVVDIVEQAAEPTRIELVHRVIAEQMEMLGDSPDCAADLAYHYMQGKIRDKTHHYSLIAAQAAEKHGNRAAAVVHYENGLGTLKAEVETETRAELLLKIADLYLFQLGNLTKAERCYNELHDLVQSDFGKWQVIYYDRLGCLCQRKNEHARANEYFAQADDISRGERRGKPNLSREYAQLLSNWAFSLMSLGDNVKAEQLFREARRGAEEFQDKRLLGKIMYYLSILADTVGDFKKASNCVHAAIKFYTEAGDLQGVGLGYHSLGYSALSRGDLEKAGSYYEQAVDAYARVADVFGLQAALDNLGVVMLRLSRFGDARAKLEQALEYTRLVGAENWLSYSYANLAEACFYLGEWDRAMTLCQQALALKEKINDPAGLVVVCNSLARLYLLRGDMPAAASYLKRAGTGQEADENAERLLLQAELAWLEGRTKEARQYLSRASRNAELSDERAGVHVALSRFYEQTGDFNQMFRHAKRAKHLAREEHLLAALGLRQEGKACLMRGAVPDGIKALAESATRLKRMDCRFEAAVSVRDLAHARVLAFSKGMKWEGSEIISELNAAAGVFRELRARPELERTDRLKDDIIERLARQNVVRSQQGYVVLFRQLGEIVNSMINEEDFALRILDLMLSLTGAERGLLFLIGFDGRLKLASGRDIDRKTLSDARDISRSILDHTAATAQPVLSVDAASDERFKNRESVVLHQIHSMLCVPLKTPEEILGVIYLDSRISPHLFVEEETEFVMAAASVIAATIEKSRMFKKFQEENIVLEGKVLIDIGMPYVIGVSRLMKECYEKAGAVARTNSNVLLTGETGTGKGIIARMIHTRSKRRENLFLSLNCGVMPETLFESALFGHRKGAYTGASSDRKGSFEAAAGGTIFLDEINSAASSIQTKLLEAIEGKIIRRLGEDLPRTIDVRLICATNKDLEKEVTEGRFREDLFHRIARFVINVPPLRARPEDILPLAEYFLNSSARELNKKNLKFAPEIIELLVDYAWPGNIRELANTIDSAVIVARGSEITLDTIEPRISRQFVGKGGTLRERLDRTSKSSFVEALKKARGNVVQAAQLLAIPRRSFQRRLKKYFINPDNYRR